MTIPTPRIEEFLSPLTGAADGLCLDEADKLIPGLFQEVPIDIAAALAARERGELGMIGHIGDRHFPQAEAWNRMVEGDPMTEPAIAILEATVRHDLRKKIMAALEICADEDAIVDMASFRDLAPKLVEKIKSGFEFPFIQTTEYPWFVDQNNRSAAGTPDVLLVQMHGWKDVYLSVKRHGLGWNSAARDENLRGRKPVAALPLAEFLGSKTPLVIEEDAFGPAEHAAIEKTANWIRRLHADLENDIERWHDGPIDSLCFREIVLDGYDGFRFFAAADDNRMPILLIIDADTKVLAGGCAAGTPYLDPAFRGRGLGKAFHRADREEALGLFCPGYYSRSGLETRKSFHRDEVVAAFEAGDPIHPENLNLYSDLLKPRDEIFMHSM